MHFDKNRITEYLIYLLSPAFFLGKSYKVVTALIVIFFLIDIFRNKKFLVFKDPIFIILSLWCVYLGLSSLWATHPINAISGASELFLWCMLYLAIRSTLVTKEKIELFIKLQAIVVIFVFINSIMQFSIGYNLFNVPLDDSRVTDLVNTRKTFGHILPVWIGLFGAILALPIKNKKFYILIAIALCALLITIPLTGTRGGILIIAFSLPLIAWVSPFKKQAFGALGILLMAAIVLVGTSSTLQNRLKALTHPFEDQKHLRIPIWKTSFAQFSDNPILGVGFHNFRYRISDYYQDSFESYEINTSKGETSGGTNHSHSPWMDILSEQGLVGLIFALTLLFIIAKMIYQMGVIVFIGSTGVWYVFSILNSTFVISSDRWSFFMILAISFWGIIVNYHKTLGSNPTN